MFCCQNPDILLLLEYFDFLQQHQPQGSPDSKSGGLFAGGVDFPVTLTIYRTPILATETSFMTTQLDRSPELRYTMGLEIQTNLAPAGAERREDMEILLILGLVLLLVLGLTARSEGQQASDAAKAAAAAAREAAEQSASATEHGCATIALVLLALAVLFLLLVGAGIVPPF